MDFLQVRLWVEALGLPFESFVSALEAELTRQIALGPPVSKKRAASAKRRPAP